MIRVRNDPARYDLLTQRNPIRRRWHLNKLRLLELAELAATETVLDAGCGSGRLVSVAAPRCHLALGCDIDSSRLAYASRRGYGVYVQGSLQRLPFAAKAFDQVFCLEVLEHIDRKLTGEVLSELHRVLKPQGKLLITTPNYRSPWILIEFLADTLRLFPDMVGKEHISKYHWQILERIVTAARFAIVKMGTFNHLSPFVALLSNEWAERLYRWEMRAGWPAGNLLYCLCVKS